MSDHVETVMQLAWQAGVFEGEGSVSIRRPGPRQTGTLIASITNTDLQMLKPFQEEWGGSIGYTPASPPRKEYWRWTIGAIQAAAFLECMWPLLHTDKYRRRVALAIHFQAQKKMTGGVLTDEYVADQWDFYHEMAELNRRGIPVGVP